MPEHPSDDDRQDEDESNDHDPSGQQGDKQDSDKEGRGKDDGKKEGDDKKKEGEGENSNKKPGPKWPWFLLGAVLLATIAIVLGIVFIPTSQVWTNDAYVQVHYATIAPRISGQVASISTDDNETVAASALLVQLDPRDQQTAVRQAEATLERDHAQFRDALANVDRQPSVINEQSSQITALEAQIQLATANQKRYRNLAASGAGTEQSRQQADSTLAQEQAQLQGARASTDAARHQLDILRAMADADRAVIAADEAALAQARLNLSYTRILSPMDGTVSQRSVQLGDYVSPGTTLMSLVPLDRLYIIANYLETALTHVLPGQHVRIHVDAYDIDLDGIVQGVPPASGAIYSPIPPNNATGNFTKIVQRLPVKILVAPNQPLARLLRAGLSVETTIDTHFADVVGRQSDTDRRVTSH